MKRFYILTWLAAIALPLTAGSLTPPGTPAPTMKTLDEVEARSPIHASDIPLVITSPGSYYFAEDIDIPAAAGLTTAAIIIQSSFVTIDLNGFALRGSNVSNISGIYADGTYDNIVIKNGHLSRWEESAIFLGVDGAEVSSVHVAENHGYGVVLNSGRVTDCTIWRNGLTGIYFRPGSNLFIHTGSCAIDRCEVYDHGEAGIVSRRPVTISNTVSSRNTNGILLYGPGSTVKDSMCNRNSDAGILISSSATDCLITGNQCSDNRESGIVVTARGCRIEGNHLARNEFNGLLVNQRSMFFKNTAYDNMDANYSMVNEAIFGPIVTTTNIDGSLASTHPWANFSYHTTTIGN